METFIRPKKLQQPKLVHRYWYYPNGPSFIQLLKQQMLLTNCVLSKNKQGTSQKKWCM